MRRGAARLFSLYACCPKRKESRETMENRKQRTLTKVLLVIYLAMLTWLVLFKLSFSLSMFYRYQHINLIPFGASFLPDGRLNLAEILGNVFIFIPLGIFLKMLKPSWSFAKKTALCFSLSLVYEVLQYVFALGTTDVTDLLDNTVGGMLGIGLYILFKKWWKGKTDRVMNIFMLVFMALILAAVLYLNME
ncbi:VanZ family protein [Caproicibacterium lactatifermentans]|uniref:VanZ family protein n=2 Tax=Caproicibacterium lactatifermentans TaxID=2666138 RepID=A0A859DR94_9FIRM|nr:VanZ family protein [Caproicibacterium lactatifermentans]